MFDIQIAIALLHRTFTIFIIKLCMTFNEGQGQYIYPVMHICGSYLPSTIVSEELLARDTHTDVHAHKETFSKS